MVSTDDLRNALEDRNKSLRREIAENNRILSNAEQWMEDIDDYVNIARKFFKPTSKIETKIQWDPECGVPSVLITVPVSGSVRSVMRKYNKYTRKTCRSEYSHLITLDVQYI